MSTKKLTRDAQDFDDLHARPSRKAGRIDLPNCALGYECDPDGTGMVITHIPQPAGDFTPAAYTVLQDMLAVIGWTPEAVLKSLRDPNKEEDAP